MLLLVLRSITNVLRVQSRFVKLVRPVSSANRELQNEKIHAHSGFEPGTFRLRSERAKI